MTSPLLEALQNEDLQARAGVITGPVALQQLLAGRKEVRNLAEAFPSGVVDADALREFVSALLKDLQKGRHFPHDLTLAALAVAVEGWSVPFSEEYLRGLAGLKCAELPYAPRIARQVLSQRGSSRNGEEEGTRQETTAERGDEVMPSRTRPVVNPSSDDLG